MTRPAAVESVDAGLCEYGGTTYVEGDRGYTWIFYCVGCVQGSALFGQKKKVTDCTVKRKKPLWL